MSIISIQRYIESDNAGSEATATVLSCEAALTLCFDGERPTRHLLECALANKNCYTGNPLSLDNVLEDVARFAAGFEIRRQNYGISSSSLLRTLQEGVTDITTDEMSLPFAVVLTNNNGNDAVSVTTLGSETLTIFDPIKRPGRNGAYFETMRCVESVVTHLKDIWQLGRGGDSEGGIDICFLTTLRDLRDLPVLDMSKLQRNAIRKTLKELQDVLETNKERRFRLEESKLMLTSRMNETRRLRSQMLTKLESLQELFEKAKQRLKRKEEQRQQISSSLGDVLKVNCEICFDPINVNDFFLTISRCGHSMCRNCTHDYIIKVAIEQAKIPVKCPTCDEEMTPEEPEFALSEDEIRRFRAASVVPVLWDAVRCPKVNCTGLAVVEPPNKTFICPVCFHQMCVDCRQEPHSGSCNAANRARDDSALRNMGTRQCTRCKAIVWKIDDGGCNHMTCICGNNFCYLCGKSIANPKGGWNDDGHQCILFDKRELQE